MRHNPETSVPGMNTVLASWNSSGQDEAVAALLSCCAAQRWADAVAALRPFPAPEALFAAADHVWATMQEADWMQAFRAHPRIGERKAAHASAQSTAWSQQEQSSAASAQAKVLADLRKATGAMKSSSDLLTSSAQAANPRMRCSLF